MKQLLSCLLLGSLIISCAPAAKETADGGVQGSFVDSLFRHNGQNAFRSSDLAADYDTAAKQYRLGALSEVHRKLLTDTVFGSSPYSAYYYSRRAMVGTVLPVTVLSEVTDGSPLDLFLVGADGAVTGTLRLAESSCDTQDAAGEQSNCTERFSVFSDDSTVQVTGLSRVTDGKTTSLDSAVTVYRITRAGALKVLTTDTVRKISP